MYVATLVTGLLNTHIPRALDSLLRIHGPGPASLWIMLMNKKKKETKRERNIAGPGYGGGEGLL